MDLLNIRLHPIHPMKTLFVLPLLAAAFFASSCRTVPPIDPMTMKQTCRCLPSHFHNYGIECGPYVTATK